MAELEAGCDRGEAALCAQLADQLAAYGEAQDATRAVAVGRAACDEGEQLACAVLGRLLANGEGAPRDIEAAQRLTRGACDAGQARGCYELALIHETQPLLAADNVANAAAIGLYERACALGLADACGELGQCWFSGRGGAPKDLAKAVDAYQRACSLGDRQACHMAKAAPARFAP